MPDTNPEGADSALSALAKAEVLRRLAKRLTLEELAQYVANTEKYRLEDSHVGPTWVALAERRTDAQLIWGGFDWGGSPQEHKYWATIAYRLEDEDAVQ